MENHSADDNGRGKTQSVVVRCEKGVQPISALGSVQGHRRVESVLVLVLTASDTDQLQADAIAEDNKDKTS